MYALFCFHWGCVDQSGSEFTEFQIWSHRLIALTKDQRKSFFAHDIAPLENIQGPSSSDMNLNQDIDACQTIV